MSKRFSFVGSMSFTGVLVVLLIVILALATFVESSYGTRTAWALVYGTHWFEVLLAVMAVNLVAVMFRYKFFNRKKVVVLLFHLAFVLILAGAAITRFISYEGIMHIREQSMTNRMLSNNAYVEVTLQKGEEEVTDGREVMLTSLTPKAYRAGMNIGGDKVKIRSTGYITNAVEQFVEASGGEPLLQVVFVSSGQTTATLPSGSLQLILGMDVSFNNPDSSAVLRFFTQGDSVCMSAPFPISQMQMGAESAVRYEPWDTIAFREGWLYTVGHMRMAMQAYIPSAKRQVVAAPPGEGGGHVSAVQVELAYQGMKATVMVPGMPRIAGEAVTGEIGDLRYAITYGSREVELPFSLFLKDFVVDRYPGSNSPSSFASEVVLVDQEMGIQEDRRIFMNNVLKHRGYRFYQSSYDNDELGTVLSVNKDRAGTFVTYLGYLILMAGMLAALFVRGTRFARLTKISVATKKAGVVALLLLGGGMSLFAQSVPPKDEAQAFGALWVQDKGGRFEPMNTLSHEVVRKITQKSGYQEFSADQVLLGMIMYPDYWKAQPLFKVKHSSLHEMIGFKGERVSFNDLIDPERNVYLLTDLVNAAYAKEVAAQSDLDKEVIKLDDRVNALFLVQSGGLIRILPDPSADNHGWASISEALQGEMSASGDTMAMVFLHYLNDLRGGQYLQANQRLGLLKANQSQSVEVLPRESRKNLEILYNKINLFPKLGKFYGIFGLILLVLQFLIIFKPRKAYRWLFNVGVIHLAVAFVLHSIALGVRWYVSGHAPMSNGYESMIFVSWATLLAGLIFVKRSGYAMALTAILSFLSLMVAGMSNMNPEITNLVPVLKSPWLTIHVAVIMAGYGFLGLASIMGLLNVILYSTLTGRNKKRLAGAIHEVTLVNHLTLIVGLYFMTAGVFLGGVWANESWGRYWGWDPKETWALITVLVYAFVAHMHRIPGMRGQFAYNMATFYAYASVMMTYFGVNYFLGGIHSYASGVAFKIPVVAYLGVIALVAYSVFAYRKQQKHLPDQPEAEEE